MLAVPTGSGSYRYTAFALEPEGPTTQIVEDPHAPQDPLLFLFDGPLESVGLKAGALDPPAMGAVSVDLTAIAASTYRFRGEWLAVGAGESLPPSLVAATPFPDPARDFCAFVDQIGNIEVEPLDTNFKIDRQIVASGRLYVWVSKADATPAPIPLQTAEIFEQPMGPTVTLRAGPEHLRAATASWVRRDGSFYAELLAAAAPPGPPGVYGVELPGGRVDATPLTQDLSSWEVIDLEGEALEVRRDRALVRLTATSSTILQAPSRFDDQTGLAIDDTHAVLVVKRPTDFAIWSYHDGRVTEELALPYRLEQTNHHLAIAKQEDGRVVVAGGGTLASLEPGASRWTELRTLERVDSDVLRMASLVDRIVLISATGDPPVPRVEVLVPSLHRRAVCPNFVLPGNTGFAIGPRSFTLAYNLFGKIYMRAYQALAQ
ncbi:MAG: hypothetical protein U1E65_31935 [Myxococcota bacterium]